jgi:hypothetical protein
MCQEDNLASQENIKEGSAWLWLVRGLRIGFIGFGYSNLYAFWQGGNNKIICISKEVFISRDLLRGEVRSFHEANTPFQCILAS